jgi:alginate O-acetyltransferase complex protein AlgI
MAGVAFNLGLLAWFKYADFLLHVVVPDHSAPGIVLPLAISFVTFQ